MIMNRIVHSLSSVEKRRPFIGALSGRRATGCRIDVPHDERG
jgi:hypothetical protein